MRNLTFQMLLFFSLGSLGLAVTARAGEALQNEQLAELLMRSTVTVRIHSSALGSLDSQPPPKNTEIRAAMPIAIEVSLKAEPTLESQPNSMVLVATGFSLGEGRIVTFCNRPGPSQFRVTLPNGEQTTAELRVADLYSGLLLLEIAQRSLPAVELAPESSPTRIGSTVLTASAAGLEPPAVSMGIIGGVDRTIGRSGLPPLFQCDFRTNENSSGAAVINREGKLLGIIAAMTGSARDGWAYAVPVSHVRRLLKAHNADTTVVLPRHRPSVGVTLVQKPNETVEVEKVVPGSPAEKVGIKPGDLLLGVDQRKPRSVYQAVDLICRKQPGDHVTLVLSQAGQDRTVILELGTSDLPPLQAVPNVDPLLRIGPQQLRVRPVADNQLELEREAFRSSLVVYGTELPPASSSAFSVMRPTYTDELQRLREQVAAYVWAIQKMQDKLDRLEASLRAAEARNSTD